MIGTLLLGCTLTLAGQAASEVTLLEAVPGDADVVVRVRSIAGAKNDLTAMIKAMSPTLAERVVPAIDGAVANFVKENGEQAGEVPFLAVIRAETPKGPNQQPFVIIVPTDAPEQVLGSIPGGTPDRKVVDGLDTFKGMGGATVYTTKGAGWVAFGPDKELIAAMKAAEGASMADVLSPALKAKFAAGDAAVVVNVAALATRYVEEIAQARQTLMAVLDQAATQTGSAETMEMAKKIYGGAFDGVKALDRLVLSVDFDAEAFALGGQLTFKADTEAAKLVAGAEKGAGAGLGILPADQSYFIYGNVNGEQITRMQAWGMSMMGGVMGSQPQLAKAFEAAKGMGSVRMISASSVAKGIRGVSLMKVERPENYLAASLAVMKAMKAEKEGEGLMAIYKEVEVTPEAGEHAGYTFTKVVMVFDMEKMAAMSGNNPAAQASTEAMLGGDRMTTWMGTNGDLVMTVNAPDWEAAKALIDGTFGGEAGIGSTASYKAVRGRMPEEVTGLMMLSAQGLVKQLNVQLGAMFGGAKPDDAVELPAEPALMGMSVVGSDEGLGFDLIVPSAVGPVLEKGMAPIIQQAGGRVDR